jgi:hypothetical protein
VLPSGRVVTFGLGFGGVLDVAAGGGWVTAVAVWPLGQVTGAGVGSAAKAVPTGATAMTTSAVARVAAQPRTGLRVGRAVDMSGGGYGIVLRESSGLHSRTAHRDQQSGRHAAGAKESRMTQTHLGGDSSGPTASGVRSPGRASIAARTLRTDRWWVEPAVTFTLLVAWLLYALVRTASQRYYFVEEYHYLSPFSSPCLSASCVPAARDFGTWFGEFPPFVPLGLLVLPFLLGFRLTCYYYRKAYYRSFWLSPPACAVAEPHGTYTGETRFPLILQNAHRYFFYAAIVVSLINTYDVIRAFHGKDGGFGIGLGTLIMLVNVIFLWAYTASCHSCRHLIGGRLRHFSKHPTRYWLWTQVSRLNTRHMELAWTTLATLMVTDAYIGLVSAGVLTDLRLVN